MAAVGATTRDEKERVRGIVRDLAAEGVIEQVSEGKYRLSHSERETVEGTVDMTSSGALYVIVEGMDKDIYVNASRTSHALHGDRVRVAITRKGPYRQSRRRGRRDRRAVEEELRRRRRDVRGRRLRVRSRRQPQDGDGYFRAGRAPCMARKAAKRCS